MDRKKILNETEYMFEVEVDPSDMLPSLQELAQEFIDNYNLEDESEVSEIMNFSDNLDPESSYPTSNLDLDYFTIDDYTVFVIDLAAYTVETNLINQAVYDDGVETTDELLGEIESYCSSAVVQDTEACADLIGDIFSSEYGEAFALSDISDVEDDEANESVKIEKKSSKMTTNDLKRSKLVGDLFDDPDETPEKKKYKRLLKKYGASRGSQQGDNDSAGFGGGGNLFGESLYIGHNKALRLYEYEISKKDPQPMDIVIFNGQEAQVQSVEPDGTMTILCQGMTIEGVKKNQVEQISYANLETPLQFGKFDKYGNPAFDKNPWDDKSEKHKDLNKDPQLAKANIVVDGKKTNYNESWVYFKDFADKNKFVRVVNEELEDPILTPIENVDIQAEPVEEWPFAVIVINQVDEEPTRRIRVNPTSFCNALSDDDDVEVILNPSDNDKPTFMKKKFIRVLS